MKKPLNSKEETDMRLKEKSFRKGMQIEKANKVGACKCHFF